jgi:hypothetical protein
MPCRKWPKIEWALAPEVFFLTQVRDPFKVCGQVLTLAAHENNASRAFAYAWHGGIGFHSAALGNWSAVAGRASAHSA